MLFQWPTIDQIIYRVMRLRRVIAVAVALAMVLVFSVSLLFPMLLPAQQASLMMLGVAALLVGHVVLIPNVTLETVALALVSPVLLLIVPLAQGLSHWAPDAQPSGALLLLIAFAIAIADLLVVIFQILLGGLVYGGPTLRRVMHLRQELPCSPETAFQQLALRPQSRRGRVLTGPADENGFFDVAVATAGPDCLPDAVKADAKVLESSAERHDIMILSRTGAVTVTSLGFAPTAQGCVVDVRDMPGDFTLGMYALFWLTDQQTDTLTEMTDGLFGRAPRANGLAHQGSLVAAAGAVFSPRAPIAD